MRTKLSKWQSFKKFTRLSLAMVAFKMLTKGEQEAFLTANMLEIMLGGLKDPSVTKRLKVLSSETLEADGKKDPVVN